LVAATAAVLVVRVAIVAVDETQAQVALAACAGWDWGL
jgi:hypothetical protein